MPTKILIDAGHGGYDNGASYNGRLEKDDNLNLALQVGKDLAALGYNVVYTRDIDVYQSPLVKAQLANETNADYFVSIHRNSSPTPNQYNGVQTLIYDESGIKQDMGERINENLAEIGFNNIDISIRPNLTVLKRTKMPAILVEAGFINSDIDNSLFDQNFDAIAEAIARGINDAIEDKKNLLKTPVYRIQIGLFQNYGNAKQLLSKAEADGYRGTIVPSGNYYAVKIGSFAELNEAARAARELRAKGYETLILSSL